MSREHCVKHIFLSVSIIINYLFGFAFYYILIQESNEVDSFSFVRLNIYLPFVNFTLFVFRAPKAASQEMKTITTPIFNAPFNVPAAIAWWYSAAPRADVPVPLRTKRQLSMHDVAKLVKTTAY